MKTVVICRDRVDYTRHCVNALRATPGVGDIYLVDHGSTYGPMLDYLAEVVSHDHEGSAVPRVHVHWRGNDHPRAIWTNGTLDSIVSVNERYIVTDCDVEAPADPGWLEHLGALLDLNPDAVKAGCGLITEDLPDHYEHADRVRMWEANYQGFNTLRRDRASGLAWYDASVDTTLALYRPLGEPRWSDGAWPFALDPSVRTADARFMARHLTWYEDSANLLDDVAYYRANALDGVSNWADPDNYQGAYGLPA